MQRRSTSFFELAGAPAPGGREAAEPGGGKRRGGAERRRLDLIRLNSAVLGLDIGLESAAAVDNRCRCKSCSCLCAGRPVGRI